MFTGIIEEIGIVKHIKSSSNSMDIEISAKKVTSDLQLGDSIAVNGTCLTVVSFDKNSFSIEVIPETFQTTSLKLCKQESKVNLERAVLANGRLGGHFVSGHVDGTGIITNILPRDNAIYYNIKLNTPDLLRYCIYRGSIAIDGTSLTIFGITADSITISLIPHTIKNSLLGLKNINDIVNIECDMLAKFTAKTILHQAHKDNINTARTEISQSFLEKNGYI
ncbi:MAG: riboflavin synthase [Burkholderiales bacterium]|nr:riboflavin synthase [Burkholderiales bacterium]